MPNKTHLLTALFLLTASAAFTQQEFGIQVGIGSYSTPDTYINDKISENGIINGRGSANMPEHIAGPALQATYQYRLTQRFRLATQLSFLKAKGTAYSDAYISRSVNGSPATIVDLSFPRSLWALRAAGLAYLNLLPRQNVELLVGAGASWVHRSQNYRSFYQVDFDNQNQGTFAEETYTDETSDSFGIPVALHLGIPLSDNWQITGTASSTFYQNKDIFLLLSAGLAYQW